MTSISISRSDATTSTNAHRLDVTITSANNIQTSLFVNQRITNLDGSYNDSFVTVANITDLQDYTINSPNPTDTYFLTNSCSFIADSVNILEPIFSSIQSMLQSVCRENDDLATTTPTSTYTINSANITSP